MINFDARGKRIYKQFENSLILSKKPIKGTLLGQIYKSWIHVTLNYWETLTFDFFCIHLTLSLAYLAY